MLTRWKSMLHDLSKGKFTKTWCSRGALSYWELTLENVSLAVFIDDNKVDIYVQDDSGVCVCDTLYKVDMNKGVVDMRSMTCGEVKINMNEEMKTMCRSFIMTFKLKPCTVMQASL